MSSPASILETAVPSLITGRRHLLAQGLRHATEAIQGRGLAIKATRDPKHRRQYANDPVAYFRDILGWQLTDQQREVLERYMEADRLLIPAGNNLGKTFLLGGLACFVMDAVAALPDEENGLEEQGARVLLPGPDHPTVFQTIYAEMLTHAARAERRGYLMPGTRSEKSVLWQVRPKWGVEVFSPPKSVRAEVKHTASGRHHRNQVAFIEEGQGVDEATWRGVEGMCSSEGNKIASSFNPTEAVGPAFQRARSGAYEVIQLDAFDHPNVRLRSSVIPDAVSFHVIDMRVRTQSRDRGPYPATRPDPAEQDFIYALPPANAVEKGARKDGHLGHPDGKLRVYRPDPLFVSQVRGEYPTGAMSGLFNSADIDAAMARGREMPDPESPPDRVGVDPAREGRDDPMAAPAWGDAAGSLLASYAEATTQGLEAAAKLAEERRAKVGTIRVLPKGDGFDLARFLDSAFPDSPFNVDDGGVGSSPLDQLSRVLGRDVLPVSFGGAALARVPDEPWSDNLRTQMYVRLSMLLRRALIDLPDDPLLREELLAHELKPSSRVEEAYDERRGRLVRQRVTSYQLIPKEEIKKRIGRSPDRSDAVVVAVHDAPRTAAARNFNAAAWRRGESHV